MYEYNQKEHIEWLIKSCEEHKDGFILFLTQSHIIFFPHKVFKNDFDLSFFKVLLKNKNFLKK